MTDADVTLPRPRGQAPGRGLRRAGLKIGVGGAVSALLVYYFLRGTDLGRLTHTVSSASPLYFALALAAATSGFVVRAYRWRTYLRPVKVVPASVCFDILMMGYLVSLLVPRSGDVIVRPLLMARGEKIPAGTVLASIAVERLFDTMTVVLCFGTYLAMEASRLHGLDIGHIEQGGRTLLLLCLAGIVLLVLLRFHEERFLRAIERIAQPLPIRFRARALHQAHAFATGLNLFRNARNAVLSIVQSLLAWFVIALSMWLAVRSVGLPIRPLDSCLLLGLGALGVAVPTPFGLAMLPVIEMGCRYLGVEDPDLAKAGAVLVWALSFLPTLALGIFSMIRRGVRVRELEAAAVEDGIPPGAGA